MDKNQRIIFKVFNNGNQIPLNAYVYYPSSPFSQSTQPRPFEILYLLMTTCNRETHVGSKSINKEIHTLLVFRDCTPLKKQVVAPLPEPLTVSQSVRL